MPDFFLKAPKDWFQKQIPSHHIGMREFIAGKGCCVEELISKLRCSNLLHETRDQGGFQGMSRNHKTRYSKFTVGVTRSRNAEWIFP